MLYKIKLLSVVIKSNQNSFSKIKKKQQQVEHAIFKIKDYVQYFIN